MPLAPAMQVVAGGLTTCVGAASTGFHMVKEGAGNVKDQVIGLGCAAKTCVKIGVGGRSKEAEAELEEELTRAGLGVDGPITTLIEHVPGAGFVAGGLHELTGHRDEALRACGRASNSTATYAGLVAGGLLAPECLIVAGGVCAVGGAVGAVAGYALQRKIEDGISQEAKERDPSFLEAHNKKKREIAADVLLGAGQAAVSGGLAKGIRRAAVPKWKVGETALKYSFKKQMTEGCIKTAVMEGPKFLRQQPDSASQAAEAVVGLVVNIGCGGLSAAAGESTERALLSRAVAESQAETVRISAATAKSAASTSLRVGAAAAKSAASASVRTAKGIVVTACKNQTVDLDQCVDSTLDIVAEAGAGAINGVVGPNAEESDFFKAKPSLLTPAKKLTAATAQQVKGLVKGKAELDLASNLQKTLENTVVRLADVTEKIDDFGKGKLNKAACAVAARCLKAEEAGQISSANETSIAAVEGSIPQASAAEAGKTDPEAAQGPEIASSSKITEHKPEKATETSSEIADPTFETANGPEMTEQKPEEVAEPNPSFETATSPEVTEQKAEEVAEPRAQKSQNQALAQ